MRAGGQPRRGRGESGSRSGCASERLHVSQTESRQLRVSAGSKRKRQLEYSIAQEKAEIRKAIEEQMKIDLGLADARLAAERDESKDEANEPGSPRSMVSSRERRSNSNVLRWIQQGNRRNDVTNERAQLEGPEARHLTDTRLQLIYILYPTVR